MKKYSEITNWLEKNRKKFTAMSDKIWDYAELPWREFKSSKLQADFLEAQGFKITWDLAGINTAFVAEWGEGKPIIGFAGEFDALKGLSQKNQPTQEPIEAGAPGHGCGHNLLGTGCLASAVALKEWLQNNGKKATVRYYGCPAEEGGCSKAFMARAGLFNDLDAGFNYHPSTINMASKGSAVGVNHMRFRFHGTSAHAGGSPHLGRSALDAVELMNVGVNYLREHVTSDVRLHYAITHGGDLPNVVPPEAEVWYYIRAHKTDNLENVTKRVRKIAKGAAMMTETSMEEVFESASSAVLNNHYLADLQYEAMQAIGPIEFSEEEIEYAQTINNAYPKEMVNGFFDYAKSLGLPPKMEKMVDELYGQPLLGINFPSLDEDVVETGSTDVGDMSQVVPLSMLNTACWVTGAPGHNWGNVATGAMSIGHKGMLHAAKIMAMAAADLVDNPEHLQAARKEFKKATRVQPYKCLIPAEVQPPQYPNPERE